MSVSAYNMVLTDAGLAALAQPGGLTGRFTEIAFGDAVYPVRDENDMALLSARTRTSLENERLRLPLSAGAVIEDNQVVMAAVHEPGGDVFNGTEAGIYMEGVLFAVGTNDTRPYTIGITQLAIQWALAWDQALGNAINVTFVGDPLLSILLADQGHLTGHIRKVIEEAGITFNLTNRDQLYDAITNLIASVFGQITVSDVAGLDGFIDDALSTKADIDHEHVTRGALTTNDDALNTLLAVPVAAGEIRSVMASGFAKEDGLAGGAVDGMAFRVFASAKNEGGLVSLLGDPFIERIHDGARHPDGFTCTANVSQSPKALLIQVRGADATTVHWTIKYESEGV